MESKKSYFHKVYKRNIRGLNLAYRIVPSSTPAKTHGVVFLFHGFMDHSGTWNDIIDFLPKNYIYIAMDFRGHGDSDWNQNNIAVYIDYDFVIDTILFIKEIKSEINLAIFHSEMESSKETLQKYFISESEEPVLKRLPNFLLGHSFGGGISITVSQFKKYEIIDGVISIESTLLKGHPIDRFNEIFHNSYEWIIKRNLSENSDKRFFDTKKEAIKKLTDNHVSKNPIVAKKLAIDNIKKIGGKYTFKVDPRISFKFAGNVIPEKLGEKILSNINTPTLIIASKNGLVGGSKFFGDLVEFIKSNCDNNIVKWILVKGGHHCHMEEFNKSEIVKIIRKFLKPFRSDFRSKQ